MSEREGRATLSAALERARLVRIADEHLREGIYRNTWQLLFFVTYLSQKKD